MPPLRSSERPRNTDRRRIVDATDPTALTEQPAPARSGAAVNSSRSAAAVRRRIGLRILFALIVALIATRVSAQTPELYYGPADELPAADPEAAVDRLQISGGSVGATIDGFRRPAYVQMRAELANWDADWQPDGWRVAIVVRDQLDRPIAVRARGAFELMPRASTVNVDQFVDALPQPVRWSKPLAFDEQGCARVKLPLRTPLPPWFARSEAVFPQSGLRSSNDVWKRAAYDPGRQPGDDVTHPRQAIGMPPLGSLRVRVSIPAHGVFAAAIPVQIRPSALVDTRWPYR